VRTPPRCRSAPPGTCPPASAPSRTRRPPTKAGPKLLAADDTSTSRYQSDPERKDGRMFFTVTGPGEAGRVAVTCGSEVAA
jgi:hypothetical protein